MTEGRGLWWLLLGINSVVWFGESSIQVSKLVLV